MRTHNMTLKRVPLDDYYAIKDTTRLIAFFPNGEVKTAEDIYSLVSDIKNEDSADSYPEEEDAMEVFLDFAHRNPTKYYTVSIYEGDELFVTICKVR